MILKGPSVRSMSWKLRAAIALVALIVLPVGSNSIRAGGAHAEEKPQATDKDRLQGLWEVLDVGDKGGPFRSMRFEFKGDRFGPVGATDKEGLEFTLDSTSKPKQLEAKPLQEVPGKPKVLHWIYEVDGDQLKLCWSQENAAPREFASGPMTILLVLKRVTAASDDKVNANNVEMLGRVAEHLEEVKSMTWRMTAYQRRTKADDAPKGPKANQKYFYKSPGLYRIESYGDGDELAFVHIYDAIRLRTLMLDPVRKTVVIQDMASPIFPPQGPFGHEISVLRRNSRAFTPLGTSTIDDRKTLGFRFTFARQRENQDWSYDFWVDPKTNHLVAYRNPGLNLLDPNKTYDESTLRLEGLGGLQNEFKFNVALDDKLFSLQPPDGFRLDSKELLKVEEKDVIEYLEIVAQYVGGTFPKSVIDFHSGDQYLKFERMEREKTKEQRTPAENRMVDMMHKWWSQNVPGPGPMWVFLHHYIEEGSWKYVGDGVKLGDATREVCRYRMKGAGKYRVVYGDLSVKDVAAEVNKPR